MTTERLKKILSYSKNHAEEIQNDILRFCAQLDLQNLNGLRNVFEMVRLYLKKKNYLVIRFPLKDEEIGAFVYKGDSVSYLVINTSLPVVNTNFAICHELYHIFSPSKDDTSKARIDLDYYENEDEIRANLFAENLLMPQEEFKRVFNNLQTQNQLDVIASLMNYFSAPFMAVFIRCCEFGLLQNPLQYLDFPKEAVEEEFENLWFDKTILKPSKIDDSEKLLKSIKETGQEYVENEYLNSRTVNKVLQNVKQLLLELKA